MNKLIYLYIFSIENYLYYSALFFQIVVYVKILLYLRLILLSKYDLFLIGTERLQFISR